MSATYTRPSNNNYYPAGCLDGELGEAILPPEPLLGSSDRSDGQKTLVEEYTSPEKFPLAYNNSVFNEDVSNFDHENWEQFSAAVNTRHSLGSNCEDYETFQCHHAQGSWHTPPLNQPREQQSNPKKPLQNIGMYPYGPIL